LKRLAAIPFLAVALLAAACSPGSVETNARTESAAIPERIVSLSPALTEILFALDLGERVVGVTDYCDYPAGTSTKARVGGYVTPSVEAILALHPDLVLVSPAAGNRDPALAVRRAGVRLEVIPAETLADTFAAIAEVARLGGARERAAALARSLQERIDAASLGVRYRPRVRALFCMQSDPLIVAGAGTLPAELLALAGGVNVVRAERYPQIGIETVVAEAPEVILLARMVGAGEGEDRAARDAWRRWGSIPAVRDGRVFVFDATIALRPGPRVAEAVERLAALLHGPPSPSPPS
jgi:iron complex transport system substrate-binding protein